MAARAGAEVGWRELGRRALEVGSAARRELRLAGIAKRAAGHWRLGYRAWLLGNTSEAEHHWHDAVLLDPQLADAHLGLYLVRGDDDSLLKLAVNADRLGETRGGFESLPATYRPIAFTPVPLRSSDDARLAWAVRLASVDTALACRWLGGCSDLGSSCAIAVSAMIAMEERDYERAIDLYQQVIELDETLRCDAYLSLGICMLALGRHTGAAWALAGAAEKATRDRQRLYARYRRAEALELAGEPALARAELELIYAEATDYRDVADRLRAKVGFDSSGSDQRGYGHQIAPPALDDTAWRAIVNSIESGLVADDPALPDNRR